MNKRDDVFPIQSYYLFRSTDPDPINAFEEMTQMRVNRRDVCVVPISTLEQVPLGEKLADKTQGDGFWEGGWSHITFGTVSTVAGVAILCIATGPIGWASGILAIGGGIIGAASGGGQLLAKDPATKKLFSRVGDASLSLNNIPGLIGGTATYVLTQNYEQSIDYANYAGLLGGGLSIARSGANVFKMQRMYSLAVGSKSSRWSRTTRGINAMIMEIDPKGLEGSHLVPQRVIRRLVEKAPKYQRHIENLANGPLGINFMTPIQHALVDPYRFRTLTAANKEMLAAAHPFRSLLLENYPKVAEVFGFAPNMSATTRPLVNSLVITGGRAIKADTLSSSDR